MYFDNHNIIRCGIGYHHFEVQYYKVRSYGKCREFLAAFTRLISDGGACSLIITIYHKVVVMDIIISDENIKKICLRTVFTPYNRKTETLNLALT